VVAPKRYVCGETSLLVTASQDTVSSTSNFLGCEIGYTKILKSVVLSVFRGEREVLRVRVSYGPQGLLVLSVLGVNALAETETHLVDEFLELLTTAYSEDWPVENLMKSLNHLLADWFSPVTSTPSAS